MSQKPAKDPVGRRYCRRLTAEEHDIVWSAPESNAGVGWWTDGRARSPDDEEFVEDLSLAETHDPTGAPFPVWLEFK